MSQNMMSRPLFGVYTLRSRELEPYPTTASEDADRVHLTVPRFRQQRSLSCEMASLRMAAHYQKVIRSEADLVPEDRLLRGIFSSAISKAMGCSETVTKQTSPLVRLITWW